MLPRHTFLWRNVGGVSSQTEVPDQDENDGDHVDDGLVAVLLGPLSRPGDQNP